MGTEPVAFAETTGPQRPPQPPDSGPWAAMPQSIRIASAVVTLAAVAAAALQWTLELTDVRGAAALPGLTLAVTAVLASVGVPLLFHGPLGKYLSRRQRRLAWSATVALPLLCWLVACWPAVAVALRWA